MAYSVHKWRSYSKRMTAAKNKVVESKTVTYLSTNKQTNK